MDIRGSFSRILAAALIFALCAAAGKKCTKCARTAAPPAQNNFILQEILI